MTKKHTLRLALASDLHTEFGEIKLKNKHNADVLILSGDITVANALAYVETDRKRKYKQEVYEFFKSCSENFREVIYIMGNHEHYNGNFQNTLSVLKDFLEDFDNIHILDKEYKIINGIVFYGGTLWTDFEIGQGKGDTIAMYEASRRMNDYMLVYDSQKGELEKMFSPERSYQDHLDFLEGLQKALKQHQGKDFIVVGHHAPSKISTHPRYSKQTVMNAFYSSDLTDIMKENPQIIAWTHGHTHHKFSYQVYNTMVLCNPRGYDGYEQLADEFELLTFDVMPVKQGNEDSQRIKLGKGW